jgi:pyrroline-5-carboxylate reductase
MTSPALPIPPLPGVAFIGGGQMARALIAGLCAAGQPTTTLAVADISAEARQALERDFPGIQTTAEPTEAAARAGLWVLAVKPQQMEAVSRSLQQLATTRRPTVLSVAAGTRVSQLQEWLGAGVPVVRTMPNRPAFVGAGITGLYADPTVGFAARNHAAALMRAAGDIVWVTEEGLLDAVTAVSGSGPAYFFLLIEALAAAGEAVGLPAATARELAVTTAYGAGKMARDTGVAPSELREQVTSKGGTTAAALAVFEAGGFRQLVAAAVAAADLRAKELAGPITTPTGTTPHRTTSA